MDSDSELERVELMVKALPVADFDDYDEKQPPGSGQDYLRRVQIEAKKCPEVVVSNLDTSKFKSKQTMLLQESNGFIKTTREMASSLEWQHLQVTNFTRLRMKISRVKSRLEETPTNTSEASRSNRSMEWWRNYCLGLRREQAGDDTESETPSDAEGEEVKPEPKPSLEEEKGENLPLLSSIIGLNQLDIHRVLKYHIKWIQQSGFCDRNGLWVFSLLACLEKPFPSDIYSTLRDLSRVCSEVRVKLTPESPQLLALNLIICIIGRYFNQLDMTDNLSE